VQAVPPLGGAKREHSSKLVPLDDTTVLSSRVDDLQATQATADALSTHLEPIQPQDKATASLSSAVSPEDQQEIARLQSETDVLNRRAAASKSREAEAALVAQARTDVAQAENPTEEDLAVKEDSSHNVKAEEDILLLAASPAKKCEADINLLSSAPILQATHQDRHVSDPSQVDRLVAAHAELLVSVDLPNYFKHPSRSAIGPMFARKENLTAALADCDAKGYACAGVLLEKGTGKSAYGIGRGYGLKTSANFDFYRKKTKPSEVAWKQIADVAISSDAYEWYAENGTIDELKTFCARDSRCAGFYPCTVASGSSAKPCAHLATTTSARARPDMPLTFLEIYLGPGFGSIPSSVRSRTRASAARIAPISGPLSRSLWR